MKGNTNRAGRVGINEIAEAIGISKSTVSRALNNHPKISFETKQKVLKQARKLGYKPNIPELISGKGSNSIALIIPHKENIYYKEIADSVKDICKQNGYSLFVCESNYDIDVENDCFTQVKALGFRSLIYVAHSNTNELEALDYLSKEGFPLVVIHDNYLNSVVPTIVLDVHQSFYDSIMHLKSNGAKRVALVLNETEDPIVNQIEALFIQMASEGDIDYYPELIIKRKFGDSDLDSILEKLFNNIITPDALIFSSYVEAYKAWQYINNSKFSDSNILVMSIHGNQVLMSVKPNITYIQLQGGRLGGEAARLAIESIGNIGSVPTKVYFSRLIIKSSTIGL